MAYHNSLLSIVAIILCMKANWWACLQNFACSPWLLMPVITLSSKQEQPSCHTGNYFLVSVKPDNNEIYSAGICSCFFMQP